MLGKIKVLEDFNSFVDSTIYAIQQVYYEGPKFQLFCRFYLARRSMRFYPFVNFNSFVDSTFVACWGI